MHAANSYRDERNWERWILIISIISFSILSPLFFSKKKKKSYLLMYNCDISVIRALSWHDVIKLLYTVGSINSLKACITHLASPMKLDFSAVSLDNASVRCNYYPTNVLFIKVIKWSMNLIIYSFISYNGL